MKNKKRYKALYGYLRFRTKMIETLISGATVVAGCYRENNLEGLRIVGSSIDGIFWRTSERSWSRDDERDPQRIMDLVRAYYIKEYDLPVSALDYVDKHGKLPCNSPRHYDHE